MHHLIYKASLCLKGRYYSADRYKVFKATSDKLSGLKKFFELISGEVEDLLKKISFYYLNPLWFKA